MELFYRELGNEGSPNVVILHGLFAASDNLLRLGKYLSGEYRVFMLDLRNHGSSPHSDIHNYKSMAEDVIEFLDQQNILTTSVIGHSMGGKVAMQLALLSPERVSGIIVADIAPVKYEPGHNDIIRGLDAVAEQTIRTRKEAEEMLSKHVDDWGVRQFLIKSLKKREHSDGLQWRFNLPSLKNNYENVLAAPSGEPYSSPVLFIAGENSDYIVPEYRDSTMRLFPKAQLKVIPDTSHWLHAQKPEVFNALCKRFLSELRSS